MGWEGVDGQTAIKDGVWGESEGTGLNDNVKTHGAVH